MRKIKIILSVHQIQILIKITTISKIAIKMQKPENDGVQIGEAKL